MNNASLGGLVLGLAALCFCVGAVTGHLLTAEYLTKQFVAEVAVARANAETELAKRYSKAIAELQSQLSRAEKSKRIVTKTERAIAATPTAAPCVYDECALCLARAAAGIGEAEQCACK